MTVGVLFQACIVIKAFAAVAALERPLFAVHQHVTLQSICTCKCSRTFRALEWFFSGVGAFMWCQVRVPLESFATEFASVLCISPPAFSGKRVSIFINIRKTSRRAVFLLSWAVGLIIPFNFTVVLFLPLLLIFFHFILFLFIPHTFTIGMCKSFFFRNVNTWSSRFHLHCPRALFSWWPSLDAIISHDYSIWTIFVILWWTRRSDNTAGFVQRRIVTRRFGHPLFALEFWAGTLLWVALLQWRIVFDFTMRHCCFSPLCPLWWLAWHLAWLKYCRCLSCWNPVHRTPHEVWRWWGVNKLLFVFAIRGVLRSRWLACTLDRVWKWWYMHWFLLWILLHNW